jgi:hypothetical protein
MSKVVNHKGGVGEIGSVFNHYTADGCIGYAPPELYNHQMSDAAPGTESFVNSEAPTCKDEEDLARILGLYLYPGRVLGTTNPGDIIQLNPELRDDWGWITAHYDRIGLPHAKEVVWDDSFAVKKEFPHYKLSTFYFGRQANSVSPDPRRLRIVEAMNQKNAFIQLAQTLGSPIPETYCYENRGQVDDCARFRFPVVLKVSESVSGLGVVKCYSSYELETELTKFPAHLPFQIQEVIDGEFISVQYWANRNLKKITATSQILEGNIHDGNSGPTIHQPWHVTDALAQYLFNHGIKEHFGFDLVARQLSNGRWDYRVIECNPRFTGAAYPYYIAWKLGAPLWVGRNYKTSVTRLNDIDLGDAEFDPGTGKGVAVVNWGCIKDKKLAMVLMGKTQKDLDLLDEKLKKIL